MKEIIFGKVAAIKLATSIKNDLIHMDFFTSSGKF